MFFNSPMFNYPVPKSLLFSNKLRLVLLSPVCQSPLLFHFLLLFLLLDKLWLKLWFLLLLLLMPCNLRFVFISKPFRSEPSCYFFILIFSKTFHSCEVTYIFLIFVPTLMSIITEPIVNCHSILVILFNLEVHVSTTISKPTNFLIDFSVLIGPFSLFSILDSSSMWSIYILCKGHPTI